MATMNTADIGFEREIWKAADKMRGNIDASEYKSVVLGLIFLKYISDKFETKYRQLVAEGEGFEEDKDEYTAENIFYVPTEARWERIAAEAHTPEIGQVIDNAMRAIEKENKRLKDILPNYLGTTDQVEKYALEKDIDEIYCTLPGTNDEKILRLLNFSEKNMIRFYMVPEIYRNIKKSMVMEIMESIPLLTLRREPLQAFYNRALKRAFDIVFSLGILCTIFPFLYIIVGFLIKRSSPGPIFFKQKRTGLYGRDFECYKFRTMRVNAEADTLQAVKDDPRKTKIGDFLRRTNLDEFPQFINVLKGDMSVVGPRPHMLKHTEQYSALIDKYMVRHLVKPGVTGWAQVTGYRGETKTLEQMEGRVKRDVWYIENWSFFLDLKIIVVTLLNMCRGEKNAY